MTTDNIIKNTYNDIICVVHNISQKISEISQININRRECLEKNISNNSKDLYGCIEFIGGIMSSEEQYIDRLIDELQQVKSDIKYYKKSLQKSIVNEINRRGK